MGVDASATLAVANVMASYGRAWDTRDLDLLLSVLTDDCTLDYTLFGELEGTAEITSFAREYFAGETVFQDWFHLFANPWITIDGDRADGRWHFLGVYTFEDVGATWQAGFYDVRFTREADGWKIADLTLEYKYVTPYDDGWAEEPIAQELIE